MAISIRRSILEPDLIEVWQDGQMIEEIPAPFSIRKIPSSFETLEAVHRWLCETEWKLVRLNAYRLIAMRNYPSTLLRRKLEEKRFSPAVCDRILEELKKNGYVQDEEFWQAAILREFERGYGPRYIEMKLQAKGGDKEKVREAITDAMQREKIAKLLPKLLAGSGRLAKQKAIRALQRRGFDLHLIVNLIS